MSIMMRIPTIVAASLMMLGAVQAQIAPPPVPSTLPPPPVPSAPPPPKIEVPPVPKMDAPPTQPQAAPSRRSSFNDRLIRCLDDEAAVRLTAGDRVAYSRACANGRD